MRKAWDLILVEGTNVYTQSRNNEKAGRKILLLKMTVPL